MHYNGGNSYLFVNEKQVLESKTYNKNVNFSTQICLGSISIGFHVIESREGSFGGNVYNFSVDCNAIDNSDILNMHKYLMVKNSMI